MVEGGALTGGRSKASIMRVVRQNLAALRYAYNKRLQEKPGLKGKVTVKFAIDEFGKVIFCSVVSTTMNDNNFESTVVEKIRRWGFGKIDKPGDVTEVIYPFVFSQ
jgi:TonB family protein